ncbi:MAG: MarR family transcriptional regulator [Hydrocarboniphaga sp.]|uniref:MarR family winged helix-turn-helix transcriptional regulator n=1 Tax=Hydrocarboniphaga sp. TaxID=2033016 RepID=UPI002609D24F|nr:MarR family transcriptional regulator [Hydrocarboniphaga sp.]MDB5968425.1 MarR family transcriptional regulator [Hydrocarboniphaga sp.]
MYQIDKLLAAFTAALPRTSRQWMRILDISLDELDISATCASPLILIGRNQGINQVALAEQVGVVGPSLVRLIDQLADSGLVRREPDETDRRAKRLWLTNAGDALYQQMEQHMVKLRQTALGHLPEADIAAAVRVQQALLEAAEAFERDDPRKKNPAT